VRNSFAPVAVFDKAYDAHGIDPMMNQRYPALEAGKRTSRTLIVYNDDFEDQRVTASARVSVGDRVVAKFSRRVRVGLGEHRELAFSFTVPELPGERLVMALTTDKGGAIRFAESKTFLISPR